jgi:hypothetical protein
MDKTATLTTVLMAVALCLYHPAAAHSDTPRQLQDAYEAQARSQSPAFGGFSAERGREFYAREVSIAGAERRSCASCHSGRPQNEGRTAAGKLVAPLAPAVNSERFTDPAKVEKWFGRNCNDVLGRHCTLQEKGDVLEWLLTIR